MRSEICTSPNGLHLRAIAGTYVVILAMNCDVAYRSELLGFGIQRTDNNNGETVWLRGLKRFNRPSSDTGEDVTTRHHPIQKFHWGDYTAKPGRKYTYRVYAFKGKVNNIEDYKSFDFVEVNVTCETPDCIGSHGHAVHFNRSAAASQAFASRFPGLPKGEVKDPQARNWLSRGLAEALIAFIDETKCGESLHLFVYEFEKTEFLQTLRRAADRGVGLEVIYDGIIDSNGKGPSQKSNLAIESSGLGPFCRPRTGCGLAISHNKYMVRCDSSGKPYAIWTGSTNFTDAGVYGQSNVGHSVIDDRIAGQYFEWHQDIWKSTPMLPIDKSKQSPADMSAADSRQRAIEISPIEYFNGTRLVLSPRKTIEAISACVTLVNDAKKMVCFTAPFQMHDELEDALALAPAHVFGLLNKNGVVGPALHQAPNTQLAAAAAIKDKGLLTKWQGQLLAESMQHSGVFIHTKFLLLDPLSENPVIVTGSANFSSNSSKNNDENQLFIVGETQVADVYLGEFMRMFDHYQYRDHMREMIKLRAEKPQACFLDETDGWTQRFFGGHREAARLAFF